ncbi:hypothetical protein HOA55_03110 [archaeon]|jgi:hypothetical protein|nr:hypothetical protein [archaeon]MBT3577438.1 hypothetical protein [archaeon]MBT6820319.1 hypothetical protein [archaeon]MBT6956130.1 hypothetical protein [archaeon]MBT7025133.1 hypothetical protein [archaeon]
MLKKKCPSCAKKIDRKFGYCPWCGESIKAKKEQENFGMLGRDDNVVGKQLSNVGAGLPLGMGRIVETLVNQLEKQLGNVGESPNGIPKGFKIHVSTGKPQVKQMVQKPVEKEPVLVEDISEEEAERRAGLPRKDAESRVRRLADSIIYEISTPGVHSKKDVVVTKLEQGLEIRAYSSDKCYVKIIPMTIEVIGYEVRDEKVFLELKG